ncbi:MAG: helix-turn-helix transcriptional regulator [Mobiluncus porci]|uniref:helix-turn-helix domain-containing protein n=1 Tax=Mobiluncus porci TaxID=2652278 RepID=UPI0023F022BC|nr:helix-turn-helix transcriptional regulator [Mobiluncus porci]MDD7541213.1 helix-turn-helix transcriptional regulator [Mobiluncus porci]MDY5748102.1 helix-turn-helix transcriptional regulator [Mobiluncus porci]
MDKLASETATLIKAAMEESGVSILELSEQAGIPRTTLYRKLSGFYPFDLDELERIARALGVKVAALMPVLNKAVA